MTEFCEGDVCVVTGDSARFRHNFEAGAVVVLERFTDFNNGPGWRCRRQHMRTYPEYWDVAVVDLQHLYDEPGVEEVEHAIESIIEVLRRNS